MNGIPVMCIIKCIYFMEHFYTWHADLIFTLTVVSDLIIYGLMLKIKGLYEVFEGDISLPKRNISFKNIFVLLFCHGYMKHRRLISEQVCCVSLATSGYMNSAYSRFANILPPPAIWSCQHSKLLGADLSHECWTEWLQVNLQWWNIMNTVKEMILI